MWRIRVDADLQQALEDQLIGMADDELLLGHRDSEWCGRAPILEEDIAFANLALDELGHALQWYSILSDLRGEDRDTYPDQLVYFRPLEQYRNIQMVELPNGDWAFSMLRQYLFDAAERVRLEALASSRYASLADAAEKIRKEEMYHYRHTQAWVQRLGLGTEESHCRMQKALEKLWPFTYQLFAPSSAEALLVDAGFIPASGQLLSQWESLVLPLFEETGLTPGLEAETTGPNHASRDQHTFYMKVLLADLQSQARSEPEADW